MGGQVSDGICAGELSEMVAQCNPALMNRSLGVFFSELLHRHGAQKLRIIEEAGLDRSYGYQILRGVRRASRDIYIRLALVMRLSVDELQEVLSVTQTGVLYNRNARDAVILLCVEKHYKLEDTHRILVGLGYNGLK